MAGVANVVVFRGGCTQKTDDPPITIKNVKDYHDFIFCNDGMIVRRLSGRGNGYWLGFSDTEMKNYRVATEFKLPGVVTYSKFTVLLLALLFSVLLELFFFQFIQKKRKEKKE